MTVNNALFKKYWAELLIYLFLIYYAINEGIIRAGKEDFRTFLGAASALYHHSNIYFQYAHDGEGGQMPYAYLPFFAMILIPFQILFSNKVIVFLWLMFNILLIHRIIRIVSFEFEWKSYQPFIFLLFLLSARFIMHNFDLAQMSIFWVYLMVEAFYQSEIKKRVVLPCSLIALGIAVKFMPLLMLYYWFLKIQWKQILMTILFTVVLIGSPYLFFPMDYIHRQFLDCWKVINPFQSGFNFQILDHATQGLPSIMAFYTQFFELNLNEFQTNLWILLSRAVLLGWIALIYLSHKKVEHRNFILLSLCTLAASLFMPHQQHYSFFSAVAVYALWSYWLIQKKRCSKVALGLFIFSGLLMICTSDIFVGSEWKSIFRTYKTIGLGSIVLILATHVQVIALSKRNEH